MADGEMTLTSKPDSREEGSTSMSEVAGEGGAEPRLMISKIVCENFKSYAGVKELGPFHKCFSSIVGPNGSGKSNVIDSMLFVFGYRARKIRSKKVAVLIHNSEHHQNVQSCTVSVHFQKIIDKEGDAFEVVSGSQFVVSRTAFRDNSSHYQLNGRKVAFKEVATLLRGCGIDLDHNRFLILQGEVEQIALMKPKAQTEHDDGMLEFLEDIIGTSRFKEPIELLSKKVEELNEARGEKLNRVKAVEKEKGDLEGAKNEAEHYLSLQREMATKQHRLYQRYIYECGQHEAKAKEKKEELEDQVKQLQSSLTEFEVSRKEKIKTQKKEYKAYSKLAEEEEQCKEKMASCETRDVRARQELKNAKSSLKKMSKSLEKEREKLAELKATPEKCQREITEMEKKLKILESRKVAEEERLSEVMESLKTATEELQDEKEEYELKLVDLNHNVNSAKSKLDVATAELDIYREKFTSGERRLKEAQTSLKETKASIKEKQKTVSLIKSKSLPSRREELSTAEKELAQLNVSCASLHQQVRVSRGQMEEARSALQAHRSRGQVLRALVEQRESGAIPGIHGRLGDLGTIDEKYDVAISTACGALDNIIVDTMDTAVQCVDFLRKQDVGVATFIGLDKMERWKKEAYSKISTPEGVPRLFDLVKPKEDKFLTAFYFALRDTLVASDLDQATRIGLQGRTRYRVVTLDGQLIDIAGTMSGGGNKVAKGRMSSKLRSEVSPQQLQQLEQTLQTQEQSAEDMQARYSSLEQKVKDLKKEVTQLEEQLKVVQKELDVLCVQEKALQERIKDLEVQLADSQQMDPIHLAKLEKQVKQFTKEHEKAAEAAGEVQLEVQSLHQQIMEVSGGRMQQQQAQVDAVSKEMDKTRDAMTKANVAIKTAARNTKKCQDKVNSLEKEVEETEKRIKELMESLTTLEEEAKEVITHQEELRDKMKEHEEVLQQLKEEMESVEGEEAELQGRLVDLRHELEKYSVKLKENQGKIRHFNNEIKKLDLGEGGGATMEEAELEAVDKQAVEYEITMLEERLKQMTPNMAAIEEYKRKEEIHQARLCELDEMTSERDAARLEFEAMRKERLDLFMAGFSTITNKLKEMYQMITLGGDAELELVDSLDPFSEGIVFSVRPPKKSWKNISNLSGGEKTLSSLALVFALHHYKPSPLYVMDEIDAALDFKNVSIVAHYIKERTKNAQFIIISLRNNMFELADRLVGIYKTDNTTKSVTIDPYKMAQNACPQRQAIVA